MTTHLATTGHATDHARTGLALRVVGAVALGVSAFVHLRIAAQSPPLARDGQLTLSGLFVLQGVAATVAALWVLVRGSRLSWLVLGVVALGSLAAVVLTTWITVPAFGPFPAVHDPVWFTDKVVACISAGIASIVAAVALGTARRA